jgi:hypothetical protein
MQGTPQAIGVDEKTAAAALGISVSWLQKDRMGRRIVPFYKMGATVRYNLDRVREALSAVERGGVPAK